MIEKTEGSDISNNISERRGNFSGLFDTTTRLLRPIARLTTCSVRTTVILGVLISLNYQSSKVLCELVCTVLAPQLIVMTVC